MFGQIGPSADVSDLVLSGPSTTTNTPEQEELGLKGKVLALYCDEDVAVLEHSEATERWLGWVFAFTFVSTISQVLRNPPFSQLLSLAQLYL
jgi:hypothetical protein